MKSILQYWLKTTIRPAQGDTVTLKNSVWPVQSRTMWNAQTEMLLEKTIYVMPTVHTEPTAWRGADDSEQVDNTMAFSLLVAAAAEAAFGSRISTDLDLATPSSRDRAHTGWNSPSHSLSVSTSHRSSHPRPAHSLEFLWTTTSPTQHHCHHHHLLSDIKARRLSVPLSKIWPNPRPGNFYIVVFARIQEERGDPSPIDCLPVVQLCWWSDILPILLRMRKRKMQSRPFGHANVSTCQLPEASPLKPEVQKRFRV